MLSLNSRVVLITYFLKCKHINPYCPFKTLVFTLIMSVCKHCSLLKNHSGLWLGLEMIRLLVSSYLLISFAMEFKLLRRRAWFCFHIYVVFVFINIICYMLKSPLWGVITKVTLQRVMYRRPCIPIYGA